MEYPFLKGLPGFPQITPVVKLEHETRNFGGGWHTDRLSRRPALGSMLLPARCRPGGDTLFANQYLAYETLSDGMKKMLEGLTAIHSSAKADVTERAKTA